MFTRHESDEDLMHRAGRGDQEACRVLVERHLDRIHAFAARVLGDPNDAEDVAQEVFLRLWKHSARWRPGGARLSTWLHRVALNLCLNKKERGRETPSDDIADTPDLGSGPSDAAHRREISRRVNTALLALPPSQRAAITLCHYQGMRNAEAALVLEVSVEALESLLARGRRSLRAHLAAVAGDLLGGGSE